MPLWKFRCSRCEKDFDLFLSRKELKMGVPCPGCGKTDRVEGPFSETVQAVAASCGISAPS